MRRMGIPEELIVEATGFADTDNQEILDARKTFADLEKKYKDEIGEEADKVREAGGLFIIGTERHESRRIDNQLRGRAGRQGDPGESKFFLSLEDDLLRLFGGERVTRIMDTITSEEDIPLEIKALTNIIESAQKKIESRNFAIRKNVLQYDDVMNRQRELIYDQRNKVLDGENLKDSILHMLDETVADAIDFYCPKALPAEEWNLEGLREKFAGWIKCDYDLSNHETFNRDEAAKALTEEGHRAYEAREEEMGEKIMRDLERKILLYNVDVKWMDHIDAMDELKRGIGLRAYGQHDPVVEYRSEGFDMFDEMTRSIREDTVKLILTVRVASEEDVKREQAAKVTSESGASDGSEKGRTVRKGKKIGRNDPCPCGSGKKYKKCCGRDE